MIVVFLLHGESHKVREVAITRKNPAIVQNGKWLASVNKFLIFLVFIVNCFVK